MAPSAERIRPSATVLLVRRDPELEVFLVERSRQTRFFPGYRAFPGGVLDPADGEGADARRRAALRELFEETGVLVTKTPPPADFPRGEREVVLQKGLAAWGLEWDLDRLVDAGHVLTPPFAPTRYDTTFYVLELPDGEAPTILPGELVSGAWWRPAEALRRWDEEALPIPPPTLAYLRLLGRHGDALAAARAARETQHLPHHERFHIELHPGVYALPLRAPTLPPATTQNCYLFDGDPILLVDPGTPYEEERVALFHTLDAMVKSGREVLVVLTHHHQDHVGSVNAVQERYGVRVLATPATRDALPKGMVDGVVADGHLFDLGTWAGRPWRVEVVGTPGHTPGHLALRDQRWGAVVAGDLVSGVSTILIDPEEGDMGEYLRSLDHLASRKPPLVLPGHGPAMPGEAFQKTLDHRRMREAKVAAALRVEPRALDDLLAEVYDDTPREAWALAERSLLAHLRHMAREGRARREGGAWAKGPHAAA